MLLICIVYFKTVIRLILLLNRCLHRFLISTHYIYSMIAVSFQAAVMSVFVIGLFFSRRILLDFIAVLIIYISVLYYLDNVTQIFYSYFCSTRITICPSPCLYYKEIYSFVNFSCFFA